MVLLMPILRNHHLQETRAEYTCKNLREPCFIIWVCLKMSENRIHQKLMVCTHFHYSMDIKLRFGRYTPFSIRPMCFLLVIKWDFLQICPSSNLGFKKLAGTCGKSPNSSEAIQRNTRGSYHMYGPKYVALFGTVPPI